MSGTNYIGNDGSGAIQRRSHCIRVIRCAIFRSNWTTERKWRCDMTMHHLYRWLNAIVLFLLLLDSSIVLAQTINIEAARKEGKVIAYGTIIPQVMDPLHRNLEKKYGVKVEYWRASATQVMERALSEWQ